MPCVHEVDDDVMREVLRRPYVFTYEDHNVYTGIAPAITGYLLKKGYKGKFESFGVRKYGASGDTDDVYRIAGLDAESMTGVLFKLITGEKKV